jgi:2,3-bisphosphoglycerate-independent phosphoglycerate mutase
MYRGVAALAGMDVINAGTGLSDQIQEMAEQWNNFDFFFLHYKYADSAGEDGNFAGKVEAIETFDRYVPELMELNPDVIAVTGDHSTPAVMSGHSWHSVPTLIAGRQVRPDEQVTFGERAAIFGELGQFPANELLPIAFAHAGKLAKFGA